MVDSGAGGREDGEGGVACVEKRGLLSTRLLAQVQGGNSVGGIGFLGHAVKGSQDLLTVFLDPGTVEHPTVESQVLTLVRV